MVFFRDRYEPIQSPSPFAILEASAPVFAVILWSPLSKTEEICG